MLLAQDPEAPWWLDGHTACFDLLSERVGVICLD
jgi:hypothetical protein